MSRLSAPATPNLDDEKAEIARREHERKIVELQQVPAAGMRIVKDVSLADSVATPIPHGLGRPVIVFVSPPRGATATGRIIEVRDGSVDRGKFVVLKATGWGATIVIDLAVMGA